MSQRLGLARSFEWVAQRRFDQLENSKRRVPLGPHPVGEVFAEFLMKDRLAISCPVQAGSPAATGPQSWGPVARFKLDLPPQLVHSPGLAFPKFRAPKRGQQAPGVPGRAEEVGGFQ